MAGWRVVDAGTVRELLTALRDLDWDWTPEETVGILERLGFHVVLAAPDKGAIARTPFDMGRNNVSVLYRSGRVRYVSIGVTDRGTEPMNRETAIRSDQAFDQVVAIGRELFGPPVLRVRGDERFAHWRGKRATVTLVQSGPSLVVEWAPNEYEDEWLKTGTILE